MDLRTVDPVEFAQRIAQAQQHEVRAEHGMRADIVILHLERDQVGPQFGRQAREERGPQVVLRSGLFGRR